MWLDNDRRTNICSKVICSVLKWIWKNISNWSRTHLCLTFDNIFFDKVIEIQYVKFLSVLFRLYLHVIKQHCRISKQVGGTHALMMNASNKKDQFDFLLYVKCNEHVSCVIRVKVGSHISSLVSKMWTVYYPLSTPSLSLL